MQPTPILIQGGMGAGVSDWRLARAVSSIGHLGVVSGTGIDTILVRRLQLGDPDGAVREALAAFPLPPVAEAIVERYFVEGGKEPDAPFKAKPMPKLEPSRHLLDLLVVGNFVEVHLAKRGHDGSVGVNLLEKIQVPHLASLFGAMLAGVDVVLMGAGIPRAIPGVLDDLADGRPVEYRIDVKGAGRDERFVTRFDPAEYMGRPVELPRPEFLAIVSSHVLATMLARRAEGRVDGFVVEYPTAGGHNAPPRGKVRLDERGQPIYGEKDVPDLGVFRELDLPFWLAGGYGEPDQVVAALEEGAAGVQVGTAFAYCEESGFAPDIKRRVLELSRLGMARVRTDAIASPTGFPFKVVELDGTLEDPVLYERRKRICDLGYLRHAYRREDGSVGWRCPSEPVDDYVRKGGSVEETLGRKCLCNALMANIGLAQVQRDGSVEPPLVTSGDDVARVARFLEPGRDTYAAADVVAYLLRDVVVPS